MESVEGRAEPLGGTVFVPEPLAPKGLPSWRTGVRTARRALRGVLAWLAALRWWQKIALASGVAFVSVSTWIYLGPASLSRQPPLQNAFLFDRNGALIAEIRPEENRVVVPISEIPKSMQDAFVAAEDARFWSHPGVDPLAIVRAAWADLHGGNEGASTITQQYVKNTFVGNRRALGRKVREAILSLRIDRRYSKKKILEAYLNSIYLGQGAYGVEAAAKTYFGVPARSLTLSQSAMLAGLASAPSRNNPRASPASARGRRDRVLARMLALKMITSRQHDTARVQPLRIVPPRPEPVQAPGFVDWTRAEMLREFGEDNLYRGGLRVRTTLDLEVQRAAERAVADVLNKPGDPDAAVVTLDIATGEVVAMVGGRNKRIGDLNLATHGARQPGSAFKPFVLAAGLMKGKKLEDGYRAPSSITLRIDGTRWPVRNYDGAGYGYVTLRRATAYSVNTVYAQLMRDVGARAVVDVARRLGIQSRLTAVPSLALGTSNVTALEMASAYSAFGDSGLWVRPTGLHMVTAGDTVLFEGPRERSLVIPIDVADSVKDALSAVTQFGTGRRVRIEGFPTYGKTGTTENHADAWFVGWAGPYVTAVWVGYPSANKPMTNVHGIRVTGGSFPAEIWMRTMRAALAHETPPAVLEPGRSGAGSPRGGPGSTQPSAPTSESPSVQPSPTPTRRTLPIPIPSLP